MAEHYLNYNLDQFTNNEVKRLQDVIADVKEGESIVITVDNNDFQQTDKLYDALVLNGFEVSTKTARYDRGLNIIGVKKKRE
ncbi:MAG: hypothetical protein PWR27_1511 [Petroclostridium sp.]|jgi:hypothetical protein|uniref:hypothetical protein n=1 Tax=Petroclostridium xylanilyticum TaxID=1792311 RepID=UPI000B98A5A5|nr:hypothetical protein [Petroclostridium xylanilyticum]MBZ4645691.1 hypothetical protein [Clostridia bacterium]MDK2810802.1 hypothetical protein [Petroclostridium sp.]